MKIACKACGEIYESKRNSGFCYSCSRIRTLNFGQTDEKFRTQSKKSRKSMSKIEACNARAQELGISYGKYIARIHSDYGRLS